MRGLGVASLGSGPREVVQKTDNVWGRRVDEGSFPYDKELEKERIMDTNIMIADVGGGRGQALQAINEVFPGLKGRMVLQDVPEVIEYAKASGLPRFIEPMAASFFERKC